MTPQTSSPRRLPANFALRVRGELIMAAIAATANTVLFIMGRSSRSRFLGAGAVDIAQPDLGSCGGISAARHIIALAQSHGVQLKPHVWGSAIAQAASLQVIAAVPVAHHSLYGQEPVLEYDRSSHPFRQQLISDPIQQVDGWVEISSKPGLGVEVDRATLDRYRT